jgi:glycosyltransferase involved in cell wall biosynthesis
VIALIPAYRPGVGLVRLIRSLRSKRQWLVILVVDDGSGPAYGDIFAAAARHGAHLLTCPANRGKGHALKVGFEYVEQRWPGHDVVCADADGQHAVGDILRVADAIAPGAMVLGVRDLKSGVPARSRLGNTVTCWLFRAATVQSLSDTQTGLRGYPAAILPWLRTVPGDRYEYELNLLLHGARAGIGLDTVPVRTIYLDGNASSHFRPVLDSIRIYLPLLAFLLSSLSAFAVDTVVLLALHALTGSLLLSVVTARVVSAAVNFLANRHLVFRRGRPTSAVRYLLLAVGLLIANYLSLKALHTLGVPLLMAKVVTDSALFFVSFRLQKYFVFASSRPEGNTPWTNTSSPRPTSSAFSS